MPHTVAAFYRFTPLRDLPAVKAELLAAFKPLNLCGTLLLAKHKSCPNPRFRP